MKEKQQPKTYYFKIWVDDSDPLAMICSERDVKQFDEYRFYKGEWIENWPEGITFYIEGKHPEDYLLGGLHWIVVSERVRQAVKNCGSKSVQFLPVRVVHRDTNKEIGPYWALNVTRVLEALDWERTRWLYPETKENDEHPTLNIIKEALRREPLEGVDIFRLSVRGQTSTSLFISRRLKRCLERGKATKGFEFIPVPVY